MGHDCPPHAAKKYVAANRRTASMIAMPRYGSGFPWNRLEKLEERGSHCRRLRNARSWWKPRSPSGARGSGAQRRYFHAGCFRWTGMRTFPRSAPWCSPAGWYGSAKSAAIALYFTGCKHAGENLAEVLERRSPERPPAIQMCDALPRNVPKLVETLVANGNAHSRRNFVKVTPNLVVGRLMSAAQDNCFQVG